MAPRSSAYYQVFLADQNGEQVAPLNSEEPIYGAQYLPRKFKVGFAHPHDNSIDLLTQDVGFLPRVNGREVAGYDLYSGGGMGMTHNQPEHDAAARRFTWAWCSARRWWIPCAQSRRCSASMANAETGARRAGNTRFAASGVAAVKETLRERFGIALADAEPDPLPPVRDHLGWHRGSGRPAIIFTRAS